MKKKLLSLVILTAVVLSTIFPLSNFSLKKLEARELTESVETMNAQTSGIINGGVYRLKAVHSSKYMDVEYGGDYNMQNVQQYEYNNTNAQLFRVVYDTGSDTYYIKAMCSSNGYNRVLDVNSTPSSPPVNNRNIHIYTPDDPVSSRWKIVSLGSNQYKIVLNYDQTLAITVAGGSTENNANVQVNTYTGANSQKWYFELVEAENTSIISGNVYRIKNVSSNKYVDVLNGTDANLTNVQQYALHSGLGEQFKFIRNADGTWYIKAMCSSSGTNRQLDVNSTPSSPPVDGRNIHIYTPGDDVSGKWRIFDIGSGQVKIVMNYNSLLAMTAISSTNNVQVNNYSGAANQTWVVEVVETNVPADIPSDRVYAIKHQTSGRYFSSEPSTFIRNKSDLNAWQDFRLTKLPDNSYYIYSMSNENYLGVTSSGSLSYSASLPSKQWNIYLSGGKYKIVNKAYPSLYLGVINLNDGTAITASSSYSTQLWDIEDAYIEGTSTGLGENINLLSSGDYFDFGYYNSSIEFAYINIPTYMDYALEGATAWNNSIAGINFWFNYSNPSAAPNTFNFCDRNIDEPGLLGLTLPLIRNTLGRSTSFRVEIYLDPLKIVYPDDDYAIYWTVAHELGHVIGLAHFDSYQGIISIYNGESIMDYAHYDETQFYYPTINDVYRVKKRYQ